MLLALFPLATQAQSNSAGVHVACPDGQTIDNGVEVVVNMRSGFTYTATAIGINGFDPVLAVRDSAGTVLCNDDNSAAAAYSASLPTTNLVSASSTSAQMPFFNSGSGFADISVVVGGFGNTSGQFLLIIEGLAVTTADGTGPGSGDPFSVHLTPNMTASGVPVTAYMISVTDALDPLMKVMDDNNNVVTQPNGDLFACDDAGNAGLCWGHSTSLVGSYVSRTSGRQLPGGQYDAMMTIPWDYLGMGPTDEGYITWRMSSSGNSTFGDYLVAFHMATGTQSGSATPPPVGGDGLIRQWASSATATSEYSSPNWSAAQATGAPDTNGCSDLSTAWASASSTGK
ncbi:MAG: hypothetical protein K8I60_13735, partial [Anaerolineae bacterium]|nr:hypothetical protein [Anaerolineae bacterium]